MLSSEIGRYLLQNNLTAAEILAQEWRKCFRSSSISNCSVRHANEEICAAITACFQITLACGGGASVQFIEPEDYKAHEARVCIAELRSWDRRRPHHYQGAAIF